MITVSVVIPAYNAVACIAEALDSVRSQTRAPHEVLIIDDGSSDATAQFVLDYVARHQLGNWRLLKQDNAGPGAARDRGVREASGEFVAFLDADDCWLPEKLECSLRAIETERLDLLGTAMLDQQSVIASSDRCDRITKGQMLWRNRFLTSTVLLRKDAYLAVGGFDPVQRYSEDHRVWLALVCRGFRCAVLDRPLTRYATVNAPRQQSMSARLWPMERAELGNFLRLARAGQLSWLATIFASTISLAKFAWRVLKRTVSRA